MTETAHTHMVGYRVGHCLLRKQPRAPRPNAIFRRWSLDCTSQIVLLDFLQEQERDIVRRIARAQAAMAANREAMGR